MQYLLDTSIRVSFLRGKLDLVTIISHFVTKALYYLHAGLTANTQLFIIFNGLAAVHPAKPKISAQVICFTYSCKYIFDNGK